MATRVQYPPEVKWSAVNMRLAGHSKCEIMKSLGIKNDIQLETWMRWYRNGETHRFHQPLGKQYTYNKGIGELPEVERLTLRIRQLEMHIELLGKLDGILRNLPKNNSKRLSSRLKVIILFDKC